MAARGRLYTAFHVRRLERFGIMVDPRALSPAEGVRAALAVGPFLVGKLVLDMPLLTMSALAAFFTCLCDMGGPVNARVRPTLTYAIAGAVLVTLMGVAREAGPVPAVLGGGCALFVCALLRIYGPAGQTVGNLMGVAAVLALDRPLPLHAALQVGVFFAIGGLWASLLTLGLWRLHPHQPARQALASCYRALSLLVVDLAALLTTQEGDHGAGQEAWAAHARRHRRAVRDRIELARANLLGAVRWLGAGSVRASQGLIRLEVAEQVFGRLIALSDLLEQHADTAERATPAPLAALRVLRRLRLMLRILAHAIETDRLDHRPRRTWLAARTSGRARRGKAAGPKADPTAVRLPERVLLGMEDQARTLPADDPVRAIIHDIIERMRIAVTVAAPANAPASSGTDTGTPPLLRRMWTTLRANLNRRSLPMRHALRVTALVVPALAVTVIWYGPYEHWLTITLLVTLQPYYAQTFTRALERVGGTVLGGLIAAAIGLLFTTPLTMTIAMIVFLCGALSIRYVSFGLFIAVLTPMIVLLSESVEPQQTELVVAAMRGMFTLLGGAIALAGCFLLWPSWEPARLTEELRRAIAAHGAYADAVLAWLLGEPNATDRDAARRAAGLASNNVEASLSRALLEPAKLDRRRLEATMLVDAALRRMAGRLSVLEMKDARAMPAATLRAWRGWITASAQALADGSPVHLDPRPPLDAAMPGADSLSRIGRQMELMAGAV